MTPDTFLALAQEAFDELPEVFQAACEGVAILTPDFADEDTLNAMEIEDAYDLLGLYHGIGRAHKSVADVATGPDMVFVYRRPVIAYARDHGLSIRAVVRHVLIHEIGHHLGFSDDDMEAIEAACDEADVDEADVDAGPDDGAMRRVAFHASGERARSLLRLRRR